MQLLRCLVCVCIALLSASESEAGLFGPSTYEECVLKGLRDAKTETAAKLIPSICRDKFPSKESFKPGSVNPFRTDTECYIVYQVGGTELGRADKTTHTTFKYSYYEYMHVHLAVPKEIANRLQLERELVAGRKHEDMSPSVQRFMSDLLWSAKDKCNLQ